jgi:hypothetical protein
VGLPENADLVALDVATVHVRGLQAPPARPLANGYRQKSGVSITIVVARNRHGTGRRRVRRTHGYELTRKAAMAAFAKELAARVMAASKEAPLQAGLRVRGSNSVSVVSLVRRACCSC